VIKINCLQDQNPADKLKGVQIVIPRFHLFVRFINTRDKKLPTVFQFFYYKKSEKFCHNK
jgi:hypothetical protein